MVLLSKTFKLFTIALTTVFFLGTSEPGSAVAKPKVGSKYAVVNMQSIILNVSEGKAARSELEKAIKAKETELKSKKTELDKLNKEWKNQAAILSEQAKMQKQQEFQQKFIALRNEEMGFQQEIKKKEQAATQKIAMKVTQLVNEIAEKRGFEMVFETSSAGLVYLKNPVDLTPEVTKTYEAQTSKKAKSAKK